MGRIEDRDKELAEKEARREARRREKEEIRRAVEAKSTEEMIEERFKELEEKEVRRK